MDNWGRDGNFVSVLFTAVTEKKIVVHVFSFVANTPGHGESLVILAGAMTKLQNKMA